MQDWSWCERRTEFVGGFEWYFEDHEWMEISSAFLSEYDDLTNDFMREENGGENEDNKLENWDLEAEECFWWED